MGNESNLLDMSETTINALKKPDFVKNMFLTKHEGMIEEMQLFFLSEFSIYLSYFYILYIAFVCLIVGLQGWGQTANFTKNSLRFI